MKKNPVWLAVIGSLALFAGSICGCAQNSSLTTPNASSNQQASASPAEQQPSPVISKATTPQPTTENTEDTDERLQDEMQSAPAIEGAKKQIADINGLRRIVYTALPDNLYGLETGALLGEYKHEVYLGEQRTGGLTLRAPVARHYLQTALAELPERVEPWLLTLPVDLTNCRSLRPVRIDLSAKPLIDRPYYIRITAEDEQLGVVNILDEQQQVVIDEFKMFGLHYVISQTSNNSMKIIAGEEMAFLFVIVRFQTLPQTDVIYTYGDRLGTTAEPVLAGLTSVRGPFREHSYDCILKVDGCPVFLMANRTD